MHLVKKDSLSFLWNQEDYTLIKFCYGLQTWFRLLLFHRGLRLFLSDLSKSFFFSSLSSFRYVRSAIVTRKGNFIEREFSFEFSGQSGLRYISPWNEGMRFPKGPIRLWSQRHVHPLHTELTRAEVPMAPRDP